MLHTESANIIPFLNGQYFDPAHLQAMGQAFDQACNDVVPVGHQSVVHEVIARRIVEIAKTGERDSQELCRRALQALGLPIEEKALARG